MALKDEQSPKYAFSGAGNCYTFLDAGYWELLLLLTLQKGGFRQGNPMLLNGDSDCCCCCCAHKDTAQAFPGVGTSLLKSPTKSLLYVSRGWLLARLLAAALLPLRLLLRLLVCLCLLVSAVAY